MAKTKSSDVIILYIFTLSSNII